MTAELNAYSYEPSPAEFDDMWRWQLEQQGVGSQKYESVAEIAEHSLGLHAARLPSPYVTVLSRSSQDHVPGELYDAEQRQLVTTVRCMRKTLHTLPLEMAADAHSATRHFRERDARRLAVNAGIGETALSSMIDSIMVKLSDEPLPHREIEKQLATDALGNQAVRAALKVAWEQGLVTYRNHSGGWNRENRTFAVTAKLYPGFEINRERQTATANLMAHYFERYGPATIADAAWWSGLSRRDIIQGMASQAGEWVTMPNPWGKNRLFMPRTQLAAFHNSPLDKASPIVNLLAHEDVALKAYHETRTRYLSDTAPSRAFNQIGEVLPTIIQDGQIVGRWQWDTRSQSARTNVFNEFRGQVDLDQLRLLKQRYTRMLRLASV